MVTPASASRVASAVIGEKGMENRRRLGEPGRLQHDPRKGRQQARVATLETIAQGVEEIAAQRAADAAAADQDGVAGEALVEQMVDADLAPFVDQNERAVELGGPKEPVDQGRLAGAEKAGHDMKGDGLGSGHRREPG